MDLEFIFFQFPKALQFMLKLSYIPQDSDFKELTPEQYAAFYRKATDEIQSEYKDQKVYAFLPDDPQVNNRLVECFGGDDLMIVSELERSYMDKTVRYIDMVCGESKEDLTTDSERLAYVAGTLPEVFTEGTPYAFAGKFGSKKNHQDPSEDAGGGDGGEC